MMHAPRNNSCALITAHQGQVSTTTQFAHTTIMYKISYRITLEHAGNKSSTVHDPPSLKRLTLCKQRLVVSQRLKQPRRHSLARKLDRRAFTFIWEGVVVLVLWCKWLELSSSLSFGSGRHFLSFFASNLDGNASGFQQCAESARTCTRTQTIGTPQSTRSTTHNIWRVITNSENYAYINRAVCDNNIIGQVNQMHVHKKMAQNIHTYSSDGLAQNFFSSVGSRQF